VIIFESILLAMVSINLPMRFICF